MNIIEHSQSYQLMKSFLPLRKICPCPKMCEQLIRLKFSEKVKFGTND